MDFDFTSTVTCPDCRTTLSSTDEEHDCVWKEVYTFTSSDDRIDIEAANPTIAWKKLADRVDTAIPYTYRGTKKCGGHDSPVRITSVEFTQHTNIML